MSELRPSPGGDEEAARRQATEEARRFSTAKIRGVLDALEPYVDGSFGSIQPAHVSAYLKAVNELGKLWWVFDRPEPPKPVEDDKAEQARLEERQDAVLAELDKLRQIADRRENG